MSNVINPVELEGDKAGYIDVPAQYITEQNINPPSIEGGN